MSRRTITLTAIGAAFVALVLTMILWPRGAGEPRGSEPTATSADRGDQPIAVFIGDSYTVGTGTSLNGTGSPSILGSLREWQAVNLGVAGSGYALAPGGSGGGLDYAAVIPDAVARQPDIVVVAGGRNDLARASTDDLELAVADFYSQLREALPDARIIVTSPIWHDSPPPQPLIELSAVVGREAVRVGAEFLDLGDPLEGRPNLIASDGLHPNEAGLQIIAERIDELLG